MPFPKITFDSDTDYDSVYDIVLDMYSYLNANGNVCCKNASISKVFNEVDPMVFIAPHDKTENTQRYKDDVKSSYLLLYPLT